MRLFWWIYRLDLGDATLLAVIAGLVYYMFSSRFDKMRWWKIAVYCALGAWTAAVIYNTVLSRGASNETPSLIPFYSYYIAFSGINREMIRSNFMNVLLFYPAGLLAGSVIRKHTVLTVVCAAVAISLCIELLQYFFGLGKAETDDIIHNTVGAVLGACLMRGLYKKRVLP